MNEALRPSTLGEILDRTIQLYRARFLVFLGISIIPTAVLLLPICGLALFYYAYGGAPVSSNAAVAVLIGLVSISAVLIAVPLWLGATALATPAMNHAASLAHFGHPIAIRAAYKSVWPRGWSYVGLYLLQALIIYVAPLALWLGFFIPYATWSAKTVMSPSEAALFGFLVFMILGALAGYAIWMFLRFSLAFPACVLERIGPVPALRRGTALSRGTRGRIFVLFLLVGVLNSLLTIAVVIPVTIVLALIPGTDSPQHSETMGMVELFLIYGTSFAVQALTRPVHGIALTLFYYDQRIRQEAFDIEWMMHQAGLVVPPPQPPQPQPDQPPLALPPTPAPNGEHL